MSFRDPKRAERLRPPRWRDPKLIIGALIVALSILGTWFVIKQAADTMTVWSASRPLVPGHTIGPDDLTASEVRMSEAAEHYLPTSTEIPAGSTVLAAIAPGELIPASQIGTAEQLAGRIIAVDVPGGLPSQVAAGSTIDLWGTDTRAEDSAPELILSTVAVISVDRDAGGFTGASTSRLEVFVPTADIDTVLAALAGEHHISVAAVPERRPA